MMIRLIRTIKRKFVLFYNKLIFQHEPEFSGFYSSFEECTSKGNVWESDEWINNQLKKIQGVNSTVNQSKSKSFVNYTTHGTSLGSVLTFINLLSKSQEKVRVVDFGGGTGIMYHSCKLNLIEPNKVYWKNIDSDVLAVLAKKNLIFDDTRIEYTSSILNEEYDVLIISSTLHYIEDYRKIMRELLKGKPSIVHLERLHAGDINKNFVCLQKYFNTYTPIMNLNIHEFNIFMNNNGYTLIYKANQDTENYSDKSFSNDIPKDYRIRYSLSLTYKKSQ